MSQASVGTCMAKTLCIMSCVSIEIIQLSNVVSLIFETCDVPVLAEYI